MTQSANDVLQIQVHISDGSASFRALNQVEGASISAAGELKVQRSVQLRFQYEWPPETDGGFVSLKMNGQQVPSGPISGTPLTLDFPTSTPSDHFSIIDTNPSTLGDWPFDICVELPSQPGVVLKLEDIDPKIINEGQDPGGGGVPPWVPGRPEHPGRPT